MDQLRVILKRIGAQLSLLTLTQRLLIASLCILMVMVLFLVSQYAGSPKLVALIPTGTPDDQNKASEHLDRAGIPFQLQGGKVMVLVDRKYPALASLVKAQVLPNSKKLMLDGLQSQSSWLMPNKQLDQMYTTALTNELSAVIRNFPGIEDASVFVSNPERTGIGQAFRKPVAQVTLFPRQGAGLDQSTVNALADLVSGSFSGLEMRDVAIIDGTNKRSHRAVSQEDFFASSYIEQVAKVEQRVQEKIADHLRYIGDVIISVNAMVDGAHRKKIENRVLDKGSGTVSLPIEEITQSMTSTSSSKGGAEPGLASNVGMDVSRGGSGATGSNTSDETGTNKFENQFGRVTTEQLDPRGKPTKINVTISVPKDYVAQIVKQKKGAGGGGAGTTGGADAKASEPSDDEIKQAWESADGVKAAIEAAVGPLVETEGVAGAQAAAGTVRAFLIPVAMTASLGLPGHAGSGGSGGSILSSAGGLLGGSGGVGGAAGLVKTVAIGALALFSIALMFTMVRKAGKASALPTPEELVGIPPALQPNSDVVGEADETDTAMTGIEVDPERLKTSKMLDEVTQLVKSNPGSAATVFNRWLATDT